MLCPHGSAQFDNALQVRYKNNKSSLLLCSSRLFVLLSMQMLSCKKRRESSEALLSIYEELTQFGVLG